MRKSQEHHQLNIEITYLLKSFLKLFWAETLPDIL